jgi:glycerate-2-kinase
VRLGLDPRAALGAFDAHALLARTGELVNTGPTGNNLQDIHMLSVSCFAL